MSARRLLEIGLALIPATLWRRASAAWAQGTAALPPPGTPAPPSADGAAGIIVMVGMLALLGLIVAAVKIFDVRRQRNEEAMAIQGRLSDAVLMDPTLAHMTVTPTVHASFRRSSPLVVEVTGEVPATESREAIRRLIEREMAGSGRDYRIEDNVVVVPRSTVRVAA
jgi:hypothetical protein